VYACPKNPGKEFSDWESVAGTAWMVMLQSDQQIAFWSLPLLELSLKADPSPVQDGAPLSYTISITNTGSITLNVNITDTLPTHVIPNGVQNWTPVIAPGGIWIQEVIVLVQTGYSGTLINIVEITTQEGASGRVSILSCANVCKSYMPVILKSRK
jgi:uncharacterized repeat protein (TIGR01451 family)